MAEIEAWYSGAPLMSRCWSRLGMVWRVDCSISCRIDTIVRVDGMLGTWVGIILIIVYNYMAFI